MRPLSCKLLLLGISSGIISPLEDEVVPPVSSPSVRLGEGPRAGGAYAFSGFVGGKTATT